MFVSKEHHEQLLERNCYTSTEQFQREVERLFLPSWHCVGVVSDLPKDGSYRTFTLFGNPVILWRQGDEISAFLNVCSHRYSQLTDQPCGVAKRLKCQYHGWEYDVVGNVRHIPEARSFRPLEPGVVGLQKYHVARCGEMLFISLAKDPPSLHSFLGPMFDTYASWFTPEMHTAVVSTREIQANWKVLVENALESYHTTEVHPKTFGKSPPEEDCQHELLDDRSALSVSFAEERSFRNWLDRFGHRMVGRTPTQQYQHYLHYPNVMLSQLSLYRWFECVIPISPSRSLSVVRVMCHVGRPGSLLRVWNRFAVSRWARSFLMQVGAEDAAIMPGVQKGLAAVDEPIGGLISTREERVFHFQKYVQSTTLSLPAVHQQMNGKCHPSLPRRS